MNISFAITTPQFKARTKTVTRRNGWRKLKVGQILNAIVKGQGLKKGEKVEHLGKIRVVEVRREALQLMTMNPAYGAAEVIKEGFPDLTPAEFVALYCKHNGCNYWDTVTRIQFAYVETGLQEGRDVE